jgi:hypothetical protein
VLRFHPANRNANENERPASKYKLLLPQPSQQEGLFFKISARKTGNNPTLPAKVLCSTFLHCATLHFAAESYC